MIRQKQQQPAEESSYFAVSEKTMVTSAGIGTKLLSKAAWESLKVVLGKISEGSSYGLMKEAIRALDKELKTKEWIREEISPFVKQIKTLNKSEKAFKANREKTRKAIDAIHDHFAESKKVHQEMSNSLKRIETAVCTPDSGRLKLKPETEKRLLSDYLQALINSTSRIDIQGIGSKPGAGHEALSFPIEELYTPLKTANPKRREELENGRSPLFFAEIKDEDSDAPLTDLLSDANRLLIIGQPGSGKTTFLRLIACVLAKDCLHGGGKKYEPGRKKHLGLSLNKPAPIPILLKISTLGRVIEDKDQVQPECGAEWRWIKRDLEKSYGKEKAAILEKYLDENKCVLLLDGLDETADEDLRKRIVDTVRSVLQRWGKNLIIVSSRPHGYQGVSGLKDVQTARIMNFGRNEIKQFLDHWERALPEKKLTETGMPYKESLDHAILGDANIQELAGNPVMLTCLCVVHWNEQELPKGKANLLAAVLRWLLNAREPKRNKRGDEGVFVNEGFKRLAMAMTDHEKGKQVDVEIAWAARQLEKTYEEELGETNIENVRRKGKRLLEAETIDSGIIEQSEVGLRFWHLTFQEHYAAKALADKSEDECWQIVEAHLGDRQWSEVIDQLAGSLAAEKNRSGLRRLLVRIIHTARKGDLLKTAIAVGVVDRLLQLLTVYKFNLPPSDDWKQALIRAEDVFTLKGSEKVLIDDRSQAAEAIGRSGDPRFLSDQPQMLPILGMAPILLGLYPVTVGEFRQFIESGGYREREYWGEHWNVRKKKGSQKPMDWNSQNEHPTWPITGVSWFESKAYCHWLSAETGEKYRLATGEEWEKAATSTKGAYPWGEPEPNQELCNFGMNIGHPTPVGLYPAGAGPGRHLDMSGNVWEWVQDEMTYNKVGSHRVGCGGSWLNRAKSCRSANRGDGSPGARLYNLGFRLARSLP